MRTALRILPVAVAICCALPRAQAQAEARPAIFAPPALLARGDAAEVSARRSPTSERLWTLISEQAMARAQAFDVSNLPITRGAGEEESAVVMEKYLVNAAELRPIELPVAESPAMRFLKTGRLFEKLDGKVQFATDLTLLPVAPAGALPKEPVMRVEILFRFKW